MRYGFLLAFMATLLFACAAPAHAQDRIYEDGAGDTIRVTQAPCPPDIAVRAPQGGRGYLRYAIVTVDGTEYPGCWALVSRNSVPGAWVYVVTAQAEDFFPASEFELVEPAKPGI